MFYSLKGLMEGFSGVISNFVGLVQGFEDLMDRLVDRVDLMDVLWFEGSYEGILWDS